MSQTHNAVIASTTLGYEGHGILSATIHLDYGDGGHQGFGGWALDGKPAERAAGSPRTPQRECGHFVARVLAVVGAERWEQLPGKSVRVMRDDGFNGRVIAIGHYLRDDWFRPAAEFAALAAGDQP